MDEENRIGPLLRQRAATLASAESCTGGLIGHLVTNVSGSSYYYLGGVMAYSNAVKQNVLGVRAETLETDGAVSESTAIQMARGVCRLLGADYGLVEAYEKGQPWFGYYWTPSWVMGKFQMTVVEEPPFDTALWADNFACSYPPTHVNIVVYVNLLKRAPQVVEFLKKYKTDIEINNRFLAQMDDNMSYADDKKVNINKAAIWFLKNYESLWTTWIPEVVANKVKAALK